MKYRKLYITFLAYSYPHTVNHPFDIIYLPNSCEAVIESFFLPSNEQLHGEVDAKNLHVNLINFEGRYDKLNEFTLLQVFN